MLRIRLEDLYRVLVTSCSSLKGAKHVPSQGEANGKAFISILPVSDQHSYIIEGNTKKARPLSSLAGRFLEFRGLRCDNVAMNYGEWAR